LNHLDAGKHWERNASAWTKLSRQGWDVYRDLVNTPAFLALLPDVNGKDGLDVGCGEGHNTRLFAELGARMSAIDIAPTFIHFAEESERESPMGIRYAVASALELPFAGGRFDFATAVMSLMDAPCHDVVLKELARVIRPGGFLQFSILHPCFAPPHRRLLRDENRSVYAVEVGRYFDRNDGELDRWLFGAAPPDAKAGLPLFEVPRFHRTLSEWFNAILDAGFTIERIGEPYADEDTAERIPAVADTRVVSYFLHVRCRRT
jgi:ubiquinone/menaquinone biosynthesis C-methylase UbiE